MISSSNFFIAARPCDTARAFSSSVRPRMSFQSSYIWRCASLWSCRQMSVSIQITPFSLNISPSLVKAAFTEAGVAVTVGHARELCVFTRKVGSESIIGKKMMSSCFLG